MNESTQIGVLRIGRGAVLHPARKDRYGVTALCGCPNTQNGHGVNGGQFFAGKSPTCKRSKEGATIEWWTA